MQTDAETNVNSGTFKHHYRQINFTSKNIYCFEYLTFHSNVVTQYHITVYGDRIAYLEYFM